MSSAAVQDRVPGDLQRQLGLEVLIGQTVGALRPPITEQTLSEEIKQSHRLPGWRYCGRQEINSYRSRGTPLPTVAINFQDFVEIFFEIIAFFLMYS